MRLSASLLVLSSCALAACDPAIVVFPGDRGAGGFDDFVFDVPEGPGGVTPGGTADTPGAIGGLDLDMPRPDTHTGETPQLPGDAAVGCSAVVSQSAWCATLEDLPGPGSSVTFVGLDDGTTCSPLDVSVGSSVLSVSSLALQGTTLAWCDAAGAVHEVDLSTGAAQTTANPGLYCGGLTAAAGGFAMLPQALGRDIKWFPRLSDMGGTTNQVVWPVRPWATRLAADSEVIYASWHQTNSITRWLADGTELDSLTLDNFGWIHGLDAAGGDRMVVLDDQRDLAIYDSVTGALTDTIDLDGTFSGLACFPEP